MKMSDSVDSSSFYSVRLFPFFHLNRWFPFVFTKIGCFLLFITETGWYDDENIRFGWFLFFLLSSVVSICFHLNRLFPFVYTKIGCFLQFFTETGCYDDEYAHSVVSFHFHINGLFRWRNIHFRLFPFVYNRNRLLRWWKCQIRLIPLLFTQFGCFLLFSLKLVVSICFH